MENLRDAVAGHPGEFPLLEQTLENASPAYGVKIEWLVDRYAGQGIISHDLRHNYTEIFRSSTKHELLSRIERALGRDAPPVFDAERSFPFTEMAGIAYYNRELLPEHAHQGKLRVLRDLFHRYEDIPGHDEYIAEVSVQV